MEIMKGKSFTRVATIEREHIDKTERTVPVAISSENPSRDWWGVNVLLHSKKAIDLSRGAEHGFPLLWRHGDEMLGRVKSIKLGKDKVLRGIAHFGNSDIAREKWQDVEDGVLTDISVGGSFLKEPAQQEDGTFITEKWGVNEVSFVPVPADATVGVNRENNGGNSATTEGDGTMADENTNGGGDAANNGNSVNVAELKMSRKRIEASGEKKGRKIERERIGGIRDLFSMHVHRGVEYTNLMDECCEKGVSIDRAKDYLLELIGDQDPGPIADDFIQRENTGSMDMESLKHVSRKAIAGGNAGTATASGQDVIEKFMEGAEASLLAKGGLESDPKVLREMRKNEFHSMGMTELAREFLRVTGVNVSGIHDKLTLMGNALTRAGIIGHSTSDFSNLLENVANKALLIGFEEADETWQIWCRRGTLPDFRTSSRVNMSTFGDLDLVYENGEYKYGTFSDLKETLTLLTYGKLFNISRQSLINDDLDSLTMAPRRMGAAANRKVGDLAYGVLTANAALNQDSTTLFHADHSNLVADGSGAVPSVTTVEAAITAMALQTDPAGNTLNISPVYLICPKALEFTAQAIANNQYDPAGTAGTLTNNNVQGRFQPVGDPRLDADDAAAWYMAANQSTRDTVEIAFLDGNETPFLESQDGWKQDGVEYKVRIDAAAAALDFRGLYMNDGN